MNVPWWPDLQIWSHEGLTPSQWESQGGDPNALAAQFWVCEVSRILRDKDALGASQYIEIHYEELTMEPESTVAMLLDFAGLPLTKKFSDFVSSFELSNRNEKTKNLLNRAQIDAIDLEAGELASRLGY